MTKSLKIGFASLRALMNNKGKCVVCGNPILDHTDQDLLSCGEKD